MSAVPYASLTPDLVLDAVEAAGLRVDGRLLALNSYENRVYQVGLDEGGFVVAKFYRPARWSDAAILEEHSFARQLADAEIPVVAPTLLPGGTLLTYEGFRFALFPRRGGRSPELDDAGVLQWIGRFIGRIHAIGAVESFNERQRMETRGFGYVARDYLLGNDWLPPELRQQYAEVSQALLGECDQAFVRAGDVRLRRLHGDVHLGNILWTDAGPHFVDLDDACTGPAVQDLWMLLSGERADMGLQLSELLAGYEDFCEFDRRELHLVEALRALRLMHYAAWLARRWDDPAFPAAFPWFGAGHYWAGHIAQLEEQVSRVAQEPLYV
ncbi:MAG: serine/threonine protein kinase [Moraxellaceae bacterium]|nr:serine/threonine protein kinase [Moraxellaceae bacterium]